MNHAFLDYIISKSKISNMQRAHDTNTHKKKLVKIYNTSSNINSNSQDGLPTKIVREVYVLNLLSHCNISCLETYHIQQNYHYLVFPNMTHTLEDKINTRGVLTLRDATRYLKQLCQAVSYMHNQNIMHRNLTPSNVLCFGKSIKIFNFENSMTYIDGRCNTFNITALGFQSYEMLKQEPYGFATDLFSLGMIFICMRLGMRNMFITSENITSNSQQLCNLEYLLNPIDNYLLSKEDTDIIHNLCAKSPSHRNITKFISKTKHIVQLNNPIQKAWSWDLLSTTTLNDKMRYILIEWMYELCWVLGFDKHIALYASMLIDQTIFLDHDIHPKELQIEGAIAVIIASKLFASNANVIFKPPNTLWVMQQLQNFDQETNFSKTNVLMNFEVYQYYCFYNIEYPLIKFKYLEEHRLWNFVTRFFPKRWGNNIDESVFVYNLYYSLNAPQINEDLNALKHSIDKCYHINNMLCAICLETSNNTQVKLWDCCHCFHLACLNKWLQINNTCPLCRCNNFIDENNIEFNSKTIIYTNKIRNYIIQLAEI